MFRNPQIVGPLVSVSGASRWHPRMPSATPRIISEPRARSRGASLWASSNNFLKDERSCCCLQGKWATSSAWGAFNTAGAPGLWIAVYQALAEDLTIELFLRPVASGDSPLNLIILVNDIQCGSWGFADDQVHRVKFLVPLAVRWLADPMVIDIVPSDVNSPKALGLGELDQVFGFGLISMAVWGKEERPRSLLPIVAGERFPLLAPDRDEVAPDRDEVAPDLSGPWHSLEKNGIWSFGAQARLPMALGMNLWGTLLVYAEVAAFLPDGATEQVRVEANVPPRIARFAPISSRPLALEICSWATSSGMIPYFAGPNRAA